MRTLLIAILCSSALTCPGVAAAQCPIADPNQSYFVPEAGSVTLPTTGNAAARLLRACPDNDGGASLPNNARIKVVVRDANGIPIVGEWQVYALFNGGTAAQGFSGIGADSIIANGTWNTAPLCPTVTYINAGSPTDATGTTYIVFSGEDPANRGVALRDPSRKWGHYDSEIPVYVGRPPCMPIQIKGRLTTGSPPGSYLLRIRNFDLVGGLGAVLNQGERVTVSDLNKMTACASVWGPNCEWADLDQSGLVNSTDMNMLVAHLGHDCGTPLSP